MPQNFTPNFISRYDSTLLSFINNSFQQLKRLLQATPVETIGAVAPTTPYTGQTWYDTATGEAKWWNGVFWTPDKPWASFTTTMTQGATITQGGATISEVYKQGRTVFWEGSILPTSAGTVGNNVQLTTPYNAKNALSHPCGVGWYFDASAGLNYPFIAFLPTVSTVLFLSTITGNIIGPTGLSGTFPGGQAVANGDSLVFSIRYQSA